MADLVFFLIIGIFLALLFLNIYFRVKVLKIYKVLVQNKIEFDSTHIFNSKKMEREVLTKYPKFTREILGFTSHIKKSILIAIILIALITIMGFIIKNL